MTTGISRVNSFATQAMVNQGTIIGVDLLSPGLAAFERKFLAALAMSHSALRGQRRMIHRVPMRLV